MKKKSMSGTDFDKLFDENKESVLKYFDPKNIQKPGLKPKRVSVDFPEWMIDQLDRISDRLGVTRQSIIKIFISDRLEEEAGK